tara:strand:- start:1004 stop:1876 length:873 start_codon:yes stop_codon:yes gene_type:complete
MPFFGQLTHGGMARMTGFGGTPRNLVKEVNVNWSGTEWTEANMPSSEYYSNNTWTITGDSGGMGDLRFRIGGDNGHVIANMIVTVGDTYTYQRQGQGNSGYTSSALICGSVPNSIPSYTPRMIAMAAVRAPGSCQSGGAAGYPTGGRGGGMQSCGNRLGWGAQGGGGCGGVTWGYLSGQGGTAGAYYPGPGADAYNGGFLNYGNGGTFWFTEWTGRGPGGYGYYGGGGGGGGWAPNYGCPGGGGGGSNYAAGLPSGAPTPSIAANSVPLTNVTSGSSGGSYIRFESIVPL